MTSRCLNLLIWRIYGEWRMVNKLDTFSLSFCVIINIFFFFPYIICRRANFPPEVISLLFFACVGGENLYALSLSVVQTPFTVFSILSFSLLPLKNKNGSYSVLDPFLNPTGGWGSIQLRVKLDFRMEWKKCLKWIRGTFLPEIMALEMTHNNSPLSKK